MEVSKSPYAIIVDHNKGTYVIYAYYSIKGVYIVYVLDIFYSMHSLTSEK